MGKIILFPGIKQIDTKGKPPKITKRFDSIIDPKQTSKMIASDMCWVRFSGVKKLRGNVKALLFIEEESMYPDTRNKARDELKLANGLDEVYERWETNEILKSITEEPENPAKRIDAVNRINDIETLEEIVKDCTYDDAAKAAENRIDKLTDKKYFIDKLTEILMETDADI